MSGTSLWRTVATRAAMLVAVLVAAPAAAQTPERDITRIDLPIGRSYPIETATAITRVSVANPEVADVAVIGERDVVVNARTRGETDVILWSTGVPRRHFRVSVHSPADRMQVLLSVTFAEVRRDILRELGVSGFYRTPDGSVRAGTGVFSDDTPLQTPGRVTIPAEGGYLTVLSDFGADNVLALIQAQSTRGNARILAEPNLMAANTEEASFLAGGEIPVPIAQPQPQGGAYVTVVYREFGVRLRFIPEILSENLIKLMVAPEVSSLDYGNAVTLAGFRIPAFRTRRVESTVEVRDGQSLIISGLLNSEREVARTGVPLLMDIPVIGALFSSTRWLNSETELVVIVTPYRVDPLRPRPQDVVPLEPRTDVPARDAIEERIRPAPTGQQPAPRPTPPPARPPR